MTDMDAVRDAWQRGPGLLALRLAGAGLLAVTGAIHLDLYLTGYRPIPVIGWLFLLQVIAAFVLAVAVAASGRWLPSAAGAGFALATLAGYLLAIWPGLFGFREVRTTAGIVAGVVEVAAFAVLAAASLTAARQAGVLAALPQSLRGSFEAGGPGVVGLLAVLPLAALVLLGVAVGLTGPAPAGPGTGGRTLLKAERVDGTTVLANGSGRTLYWFVPDTATTSNCNGTCASYWPPVPGPATEAGGITGRLGTIRRSDGSTQATYNGHPLYTYVGDTAAGEARGNNLDLNGGIWHEIPVSG